MLSFSLPGFSLLSGVLVLLILSQLEIVKIEIPITNKLIIKDLLNYDTIFMSIILSWDK